MVGTSQENFWIWQAFYNVIQYNVTIFCCDGLRRQTFWYFMLQLIFLAFFKSRDVENRLFRVKMIQIEIFNVFGR